MGTKWGHREVVEGQWEAIAIAISPLVKFKVSLNTKCPINAYWHRYRKPIPKFMIYEI